MAIINVTQKNFSKLISEKIDNMGFEGMMASAILGGREELRKSVASLPDEQLLWVNTDHVAAASGLTKVSETGDVVFRIWFNHPGRKDGDAIWLKGDDYKRFILAWNGEASCINEGEYEVASGYRATVSEDGSKVKVEKKEG